MRRPRLRALLWVGCAGALLLAAAGSIVAALGSGSAPVDWGASAILYPWRRPLTRTPRTPVEVVTFSSGDVRLEGWLFRPDEAARGERTLVVYLHGIADNRQSGIGVAQRLVARGHPVFVFDARAHGRSGGDACTYGYYERHDVSRALDTLQVSTAVLIGHSLGAAVALQSAAVDRRVVAVVAASAFSDLPTIVRERARRFLLPQSYVETAIDRAGALGHFSPAEASPLALAPGIEVPVLLLHGANDTKTPPEHSRRIAAALRAPHRLVVLADVGHDEILAREEAWREILAFLEPLTPLEPPRADRRRLDAPPRRGYGPPHAEP